MTNKENKNNQDEITLEPKLEKSRTVCMVKREEDGNDLKVKISKQSIDDKFVEEVANIQLATTSISTVLTELNKQVEDLNKKFEMEKKRTRRKEWVNRGKLQRKGKYY